MRYNRSTVILCWTLLTLFGTSTAFPQNNGDSKISIDVKNLKLTDALILLQDKAHIHIDFSKELVNESYVTQLRAENESWRTVLKNLLSSAHLTFRELNHSGEIVLLRVRATRPDRVIRGRVVDITSNQPLIGVTIRVKGTQQATTTNESGDYSVKIGIENAVLVVTYIGYQPQEVQVGTIGVLNIRLAQRNKSLNEVVVQARRKANTEAALLNDRRANSVVSDGISARQIEKTASITTTQALQRVTGVTITDDKYVAIRGLGDRAVVTELNGIRLSSANPDRSAAPVDLVPAALLENVTVYKTLTPDRPADASAGIVELKTKSVPDSLTVIFTTQTGTNSSIGLGGTANSFQGSDLGYFGQHVKNHDLSPAFLNLANQYPRGIRDLQALYIQSRHDPALTAETFRINQIMHRFDAVLTTSYQKAVPNQLYTATFGDTYKIFHGHELGVIISGNYYRRTEDRYNGQLNQYSIYQGLVTGPQFTDLNPLHLPQPLYVALHIPQNITPDDLKLGKYLSYRENTGIEDINYGVLAGITYEFNKRNEVSAQYLASRGAEQSGSNLTGTFSNTGLNYPVYNVLNLLKQQYRIFNTLNLQGEHKFLSKPWSPLFSWNVSSSTSKEDDPDNRTTNYVDAHSVRSLDAAGLGVGNDHYQFVTGQAHDITPESGAFSVNPSGRFYRTLNEKNYNVKGDLTQPFTIARLHQEIKLGVNYLKRSRTYAENISNLPGTATDPNTGNINDDGTLNTLLNGARGDLNALVATNQIGYQNTVLYDQLGEPRVAGFLYQTFKTPNNYRGYYQTRAGYLMLDGRLASFLRIVGGVRFESTDISSTVDTNHVNSQIFAPPALSVTNVKVSPVTRLNVGYKPYYSANLIYAFRKNMNFRLAFNTALARPELREITNVYEYDSFQFGIVVGNPRLTNQFNRNYDFRWEWFQHSGEVLSASVFYKQIYQQLTKTFSEHSQGNLSTSPEYPIIKFSNDPNEGRVYGIEVEVRKDLGKLWFPFKHFFIGSNVLLAASSITKNSQRLDNNRIIDRRSSTTSPVFEQAPYSVNAYLDYDNSKSGSNATISFNEVGERLVQVNLDGTPDLFDRPAPVLDFVFSQHFWKRFTVKGFAKNILDSERKIVYAIPGTNGLYRGQEYIYKSYKRGVEFSLGLTYALF